jgi:hypothetical protein
MTMTEETRPTSEEPQTSQSKANPWEDVVRDFQSLGRNIASAIQSTLDEEKTKERLQELQTNIETISNQVANSIDEAVHSPKVSSAKKEAEKAVHDARIFGNQAYHEAKPHLVGALESLNRGIEKIIERLNQNDTPPSPPTGQGE